MKIRIVSPVDLPFSHEDVCDLIDRYAASHSRQQMLDVLKPYKISTTAEAMVLHPLLLNFLAVSLGGMEWLRRDPQPVGPVATPVAAEPDRVIFS